MAINEWSRARIELDVQQAETQLEALRAKAAAIRKELNRKCSVSLLPIK